MSFVAVGATASSLTLALDKTQALTEARADLEAKEKAARAEAQAQADAAAKAKQKAALLQQETARARAAAAAAAPPTEAKKTKVDNAAPVLEVTPEDGNAPSATAMTTAATDDGIPWKWVGVAALVGLFAWKR